MLRLETEGPRAIRILPEAVANQIAAGEVVERPAAVVKELVENSLDAGAQRVRVSFERGGKHRIVVEDDGRGMNADEALLCLERHATSKLAEAADLGRIATLGFRGEALPSIASVSRFSLRTRPAGSEAGTEVRVNGGRLLERKACGMAQGTRIEVAQLFCSVPARRKFMRTEATESAHIVHLMKLYAVAYPEVAFSLHQDGREVFRSPACPSLRERIAEVWGPGLAEVLEPLPGAPVEEGGLRLDGLIGRPGAGRATRQELFTLVNGRPVDCRTLAYAVSEAYEGLLPRGRYPAGFLLLTLPPEAVDVNVHPAKREVRFHQEGRVRQFVREAVLRGLGGGSTGAEAPPTEPGAEATEAAPAAPPAPRAAEAAVAFGARPAPAPVPAARPGSPPPPPARHERGSAAHAGATGWRWLGRLEGLAGCALFETPEGLVVLDGGAARARIRYERILAAFSAEAPRRQELLLPVPFEVAPLTAAALEEARAFLEAGGLAFELFGRNYYRLTAVPDWLEPDAAEAFARDLIERLGEGSLRPAGGDGRERTAREELARLACRVQQEDRAAADADEAARVVEALLSCDQPLVDPQGRPTFFELSHREVLRRLGRA